MTKTKKSNPLKDWEVTPVGKSEAPQRPVRVAVVVELDEYTKIRRFYAWVGFLAIAISVIWAAYAIVSMKRVSVVVNDYNAQQEAVWSPLATALEVYAEISAYTSDPAEADDSPFITAANTEVRPGIVANNCYKFGTRVMINGVEYEVWDRMNSRYGCQHFDIWMEDKAEALEWGRQEVKVIIINDND